MSFYMVLCPQETTWEMSPETFTSRLMERWPDATVKPGQVPGIDLGWRLQIAGSTMLGTFHHTGRAIGLEGSFEGYAIFACWYRTIVPPEVPLVLTDEDYTTIYPLMAETTPDDITSERIARPAR